MNNPKQKAIFGFIGLVATFIGNGIGRFGYITLLPVLIQAGWFSKAEASQLGVATLIGYLFGPPIIQYFKGFIRPSSFIKLGMILCSLSYVACSIEALGFIWFYVWRLLAGFGGSLLMVLAAPMLLPFFNISSRGKASGFIFSGIGLGAALSGLMIPLIVPFSVELTWIAMGSLCLLLTITSWSHWRTADKPILHKKQSQKHAQLNNRIIWALVIAYGLNAIGFLPHTLFWVDFMVREIGFTLLKGGTSWSLFGLGAAIGPFITGSLGDIIGLKRSLLLCFFLKACAVALPLMSQNLHILYLSAFMVGLFTPGVVTLMSTYALQLVGQNVHQQVWGQMTFAFALIQALAGFIMAGFINVFGSYIPLFAVSASALIIALFFIMKTSPKQGAHNEIIS